MFYFYISWEMTPTSIGDEKQASISGGVNPPADIASGRIAEVRSRSMSCNCMTRTSQQECRGILEFLIFQTAMMSVDFLYYTPRYPILILQEFLLSIPMFSV